MTPVLDKFIATGISADFPLSQTPDSTKPFMAWWNGLGPLNEGEGNDFTLNANVLTLAQMPQAGQSVAALYYPAVSPSPTPEPQETGPLLTVGLRLLLLQITAVTAIIGTPAERADLEPGGRPGSGVWCVQMPEEALLPGIAISNVGGRGTPSLDGADALHWARIQFSCYATTYLAAKMLSRAVRNSLEGYTGTLPDGTFVGDAALLLEMDAFEEATFSFNCPVDFGFAYSEN